MRRATDAGDSDFWAFRRILSALTLREAERHFNQPHAGGRRVVGVYLGWNGDPTRWRLSSVRVLTHASFWDRYRTAKGIGDGEPLRQVIRAIVSRTKERPGADAGHPGSEPPESALVLIGHSISALMPESAFRALLMDRDQPLVHETPGEARGVEVRRDGRRVAFADVVMALNSAADSSILKGIEKALQTQRLTKTLRLPTTGRTGTASGSPARSRSRSSRSPAP